MKKIKLITFDLDDTLWDNVPTIKKAEVDTRKWIEEKVGEVEWGDFNDFINLREELIEDDPVIEWDISILRKEIFRKKLAHVNPSSLRNKIVEEAFNIFIKKRHEIKLFDGVEEALEILSKKYSLGVLTNGNADIYKFPIGKYFKFSISALEAKNSKPNRAHFDMAIKVGKPVARKAVQLENKFIISECPLAGTHIKQGMDKIDTSNNSEVLSHPLEILAKSMNIENEKAGK